MNTGQLNTGQLNTGQLNTGQLNTGQLNTGQLNTGQGQQVTGPDAHTGCRWRWASALAASGSARQHACRSPC
ncbi:MAG: hypothetical protein ACKO4U_14090 [Caldilinea sp.]